MEEPLSAAELTSAGEPRSCARLFWENIATGNPEIAQEIARSIRVPLVTPSPGFGQDQGGDDERHDARGEDEDEFVDAG